MGSGSIGKKRIVKWIVVVFSLGFILTLSVGGYFLKKGVHFEELSFGGITLSQSFLIWDDKLELDIADVSLKAKDPSSPRHLEKHATQFIGKAVEFSPFLIQLFRKFHINSLVIDGATFEIDLYREADNSQIFSVQSENIIFNAELIFEKESLRLKNVDAASTRFNAEISGNMLLDGRQGELSGDLSVLLHKRFPVQVSFIADEHKVTFSGQEAGEITEINSLVDLFALDHEIQRWITDYLKGSRYHLKSLRGSIPWNKPEDILGTLEAEVRVDDTQYTFAPGLEAIKASSTTVRFKDGILQILPHGATFYGQDCGSSKVDINFNNPENIVLTAYIKTTAVANDDILNLLNYYEIPLPFKQIGGTTATDLQLAIVLNTEQLEAKGVFDIKEGMFAWGGEKYGVRDAHIQLTDSEVTIDRLKVSYEDVITAQVSGTVHTRENAGDLDIALEMLNLKLGESTLTIDERDPLRGAYHFDPKGQVFDARSSSWLLDSLELKLGAFRAPINEKDLSIQLDKVDLGIPPGISSEISGHYSIKNRQADFTCKLLQYHTGDLELITSALAVDIQYDQGLIINTSETAEWELSKMPVTLFPSRFKYSDDIFSVVSSRISYGRFFDSYLAGFFNRKEGSGRFSLQKIDVTNPDLEERLTLGQNVDLEVSGEGGNYLVFFPLFNLQITTDAEKNWSAKFGDLSAVYSRSKILQKYKIKEGSLELSSINGKRPYSISANVKAPFSLLVQDGIPIENLSINGQLSDTGTFAEINNDLVLEYVDNTLRLRSQKLGYNISAIQKMLKTLEEPPQAQTDTEKNETPAQPIFLSLEASDSQLYLGPNSRILADSIKVERINGKFQMDLVHGPGKISLELEDGTFLLNGTGLDDRFMGALIENSNFQGGAMSVTAKGDVDEFSAILEIKNTRLRQLTTVNNVMAFLDTIPALVTLSLPEYNLKGLPIDSVLAGILFKDKVATVQSLEILSPALHAEGMGSINFADQTIDMDVNLKTQAGKNIGKIPIVGYLLAGKNEDESLSLKITGELNDPQVDYSVLKNIVVYPAELLYRTLKLPFHLGGKILNSPAEEKKSP
ncbi:AsmA-like C-terminal domain-containing protein [Desulforhopalus sp. IMCC35007]|uniref:YhdP family protein n=1 Tax=Desulforhopalus sp. IMCC35007 TaxID=2569543 RepID=UPI0010AEDB03|nr:AsmA-like C-terminal domain-containing protein [Desulforhopalus sp. IMCC35007]TKB09284.1 DUF3971 domain-containing protein [Desulforhopalus sp. IMCC35007]